MLCIVTAGPTYEPLDEVRRLTNLSTGELGSRLAQYLIREGRQVLLLRGTGSVAPLPSGVRQVRPFTTTADLRDRLKELSRESVSAIFHAAAVCDFRPARIYSPTPDGRLMEVQARKIPTEYASLLVELVPTEKIIAQLRDWFPKALLVGWKYEVVGNRADVLAKASAQLRSHRTGACVANGPAYGSGFGLVRAGNAIVHLSGRQDLFRALSGLIGSKPA